MVNNRHIPTVQELLPGTILLNKFSGKILISKESYDLNGTYLIKFHNETLKVNGKTFVFSEISLSRPLPAVVQPISNNPRVERTLTLELIGEMIANNTEAIELLNIESKVGDAINIFLVISMIIIMFSICLKGKCYCRTKQHSDGIAAPPIQKLL